METIRNRHSLVSPCDGDGISVGRRVIMGEMEKIDDGLSSVSESATLTGSGKKVLTQMRKKAMLAAWRGDLVQALEIVCNTQGLLDGYWVSVAAGAGYDVWRRVVIIYASRLEKAGESHLAVVQWLSIGEVYRAVRVYLDAGLVFDALVLGRARLDCGDGINFVDDSQHRKNRQLINCILQAYGKNLAKQVPPFNTLSCMAFASSGEFFFFF